MNHLRLRTEYSFRKAFGQVDAVIAAAGGTAAAITDLGGTWGHVAWNKACKRAGVKPIFGVELALVDDATRRERQPTGTVVVLALNDEGLQTLYALVTKANGPEHFYYTPRIDYSDLLLLPPDQVAVLYGPGTKLTQLASAPHHYLLLTPSDAGWNRRAMAATAWPKVVAGNNYFITPSDRHAYEILAQRDKQTLTTPQHILTEDELKLAIPEADAAAFANTTALAEACHAHLPVAENIHIVAAQSLYEQCLQGAKDRGFPIQWDGTRAAQLASIVYHRRLEHELKLIEDKQFTDYFNLVGDMVRWAKQHMLVGPARGSSAGSLVCYLLGITDVDPIVHDLMFERFIDVTRSDLPDIDIDFQDDRRELVFQYLRDTYGEARVGRIGTVSRLKAKSSLGDVAKELGIPPWEIRDVQDAVIERSTGDARAQFAVMDALESLDIGRKLVEKYPGLAIAGLLEGHAQHTGKHAAGIIVAQNPIQHYCSIDNAGQAQIDKKDAEALNMLKIDALGLRTLSILQDVLEQIGKTRDWLVTYPLDDTAAFEILNEERYSGIFQFEGYALQSLCRQMKVQSFDDLQVIGALARPGPLHCGAATEFIERRTGKEPITYLHSLCEPATRSTYGIVIYQEQVMALCREVGNLSWSDVTELRKAMSKSLGEEFFNTYYTRFEAGAVQNGLPPVEAKRIWDKICTFGSWAFNKSHSVSYGIISYWCCVLKAHWPLEFAAACLRNEKDAEQGIRILRDLAHEGFTYVPVDVARSGLTWSVSEGQLLGGLTNIKGIGASKAADILKRRSEGRDLLPGQRKLLSDPVTPYDDLFEAQRRFGDLYANPKAHAIVSGKVAYIKDIQEPGEYLFIGKLKEKNLRDMNEYGNVVKRGGKLVKVNPLFLNLVLEDDSGSIIAKVNRREYKVWGLPLVEKAKVGEWFLWKGRIRNDGWRLVQLSRWRCLEDPHPLTKKKTDP